RLEWAGWAEPLAAIHFRAWRPWRHSKRSKRMDCWSGRRKLESGLRHALAAGKRNGDWLAKFADSAECAPANAWQDQEQKNRQTRRRESFRNTVMSTESSTSRRELLETSCAY